MPKPVADLGEESPPQNGSKCEKMIFFTEFMEVGPKIRLLIRKIFRVPFEMENF